MKPLQKLDAYFDAGPWPARTIPWATYLVCLMAVGFARDLDTRLYPIAYTGMCLVTGWLLWRYRHRFTELNWKWHWAALPVGVIVAVVWIVLGWWMTGEFSQRFEALKNGQFLGAIDPEHEDYDFRQPRSEGTYGMGLAIGWVALVLRLLGMSIVVPMFEELFVRSLLLRSFHNARQTAIGLFQIVSDMPLVGDALAKTKLAERADNHGAVFTKQFHATPLGAISISGFLGSTLLFTASHLPRDWFACFACAAFYCGLLWWTNIRRQSKGKPALGLGPIVWAHGITNALLWAYTVTTNDWQFL